MPNNCLVGILAVFPIEPSIVFTIAAVVSSISCWSLSLSNFDMKNHDYLGVTCSAQIIVEFNPTTRKSVTNPDPPSPS